MDEEIEFQEVNFLISNLRGDCFNKYEEILERLKNSDTYLLNVFFSLNYLIFT